MFTGLVFSIGYPDNVEEIINEASYLFIISHQTHPELISTPRTFLIRGVHDFIAQHIGMIPKLLIPDYAGDDHLRFILERWKNSLNGELIVRRKDGLVDILQSRGIQPRIFTPEYVVCNHNSISIGTGIRAEFMGNHTVCEQNSN